MSFNTLSSSTKISLHTLHAVFGAYLIFTRFERVTKYIHCITIEKNNHTYFNQMQIFVES
jgi:hypothetical protein